MGSFYINGIGSGVGGTVTSPSAYQGTLTNGGIGGMSVAPGGSASQSSQSVNPQMMGVYNQLLGLNQQNYSNVMNAYNSGQNNLSSNLPGIYGGYSQLSGDVMNTLGLGNGGWGVAAPAAQAIGQQFAQQAGATTQQLTDRGLGNTTAVSNANNQNSLFAGQAYGSLGAQLAQTAAGYQSQIGMAGLGARMQGLGMQTGLTQAGLPALGQQFSNTAGNLMGSQSSSYSAPSLQQQYGGGGVGASSSPYGPLTPWGTNASGWSPGQTPHLGLGGATSQQADSALASLAPNLGGAGRYGIAAQLGGMVGGGNYVQSYS